MSDAGTTDPKAQRAADKAARDAAKTADVEARKADKAARDAARDEAKQSAEESRAANKALGRSILDDVDTVAAAEELPPGNYSPQSFMPHVEAEQHEDAEA